MNAAERKAQHRASKLALTDYVGNSYPKLYGVSIDGKHIGSIEAAPDVGRYRFHTNSGEYGESLPSIAAVKASITRKRTDSPQS